MRLSTTAQIRRAPARSMPWRSDSIPTINPGSSAKSTIGRWNVSQSCSRRATLAPAATSVAPAEAQRVVDHHADGEPVDPGQTGDAGTAVERGDLEERALVDHGADDPSRVERSPRVAVDGVGEGLVTAVGRVGGLAARRHLVDGRGQVRQEAADLVEGVVLVLGEVVDDAALADVDVRAAELLLRDLGARRRPDDGRTAREDLGVALRHHVEVGQHGVQRGQPGDRAEHRRGDRHRVQQLDVDVRPTVAVGQVGAPERLEAAHAATGGVEQPNVREAPLERPLGRRQLGPEPAVGAAGRAAPDREVAAHDDDLAPVDADPPVDLTGRQHRLQRAVVAVRRVTPEPAERAERPLVREPIDALANRQLAEAVLALDALRATQAVGELAPARQLVELGSPRHGCQSSSTRASPSCTAGLRRHVDGRHRPGPRGDTTGISIFIDSRIISSSPSATASPTCDLHLPHRGRDLGSNDRHTDSSHRTDNVVGDGSRAPRSASRRRCPPRFDTTVTSRRSCPTTPS